MYNESSLGIIIIIYSGKVEHPSYNYKIIRFNEAKLHVHLTKCPRHMITIISRSLDIYFLTNYIRCIFSLVAGTIFVAKTSFSIVNIYCFIYSMNNLNLCNEVFSIFFLTIIIFLKI